MMKSAMLKQMVALGLMVAASGLMAAEGRHALIIGIGQYSAASGSDTLPGVPVDMQNARKMARAMGIDEAAIVELRDSRATKSRIISALEKLRDSVKEGDRVLIYFSGHGARHGAPGKCSEGLQTFTEGRYTVNDLLTEEELARYTFPIGQKADKIITFIDACHSGGLLTAKTRSLGGVTLRARASNASSDCSVAVNQRNTRSFGSVMSRLGAAQENFVQIAAADYNEVSWDNPQYGGLVTHTMTQCLVGDARDLDRSGAVSLDEIRACAQTKLNDLMKPHAAAGMAPSTIQVRGSRNLIVVPVASQPARPTGTQVASAAPGRPGGATSEQRPSGPIPPQTVSQVVPSPQPIAPPSVPAPPPVTESSAPQVAVPAPQVAVPAPQVAAPAPQVAVPAPQVAVPAPQVAVPATQVAAVTPQAEPPSAPEQPQVQQLASMATLNDILAQRNGHYRINVSAPSKLVINKDFLNFSVRSSVDGYLYAVMLGSDGKSFYLLFPNRLDGDNKIKANVEYKFPRPGWAVKAGGPEGVNNILFVVSQSPRDPKIFVPEDSGGGVFTFSVTDLVGRQRLIDFFLGRGVQGRNGAMAANLVKVQEVRP